MAKTENNSANKQTASDVIDEESHIYEDEVCLMDYFLVIWKHKRLILVCSLLPTLVIGLSIYLSPKSYLLTYTYDVGGDARVNVRGDAEDSVGGTMSGDISHWNLNEKNFHVLHSRFYSEDNINKIAGKLQKDGFDEYANQVRKGAVNGLKRFVELKVSPSFADLSKLKVTNPDYLDRLRDMEASLLNMKITGKPKEYLAKTALTIRNNLEEVIPLYMIQEQLSADIRGYNSKQANIESSRFILELGLKYNIEMLAGLKNVDVAAIDKEESNIVFQFDVSQQSQYLPLPYQIQALGSKIVELKGEINSGTANYKYYKDLSGLSAQMIAELNDKLSSGQYYTIELFKSFLADLIGEIEKQELKDYLASHIKKIENRISESAPVLENPGIYPVAKGMLRKIAVVFVITLTFSIFAVFLLEGLKKSQSRVS